MDYGAGLENRSGLKNRRGFESLSFCQYADKNPDIVSGLTFDN